MDNEALGMRWWRRTLLDKDDWRRPRLEEGCNATDDDDGVPQHSLSFPLS
jgi:hypothetical protein